MENPSAIKIDDIFDVAFRFVTETNENIFLTGKAGTGKTTFLRYLKNNCVKNIVVAAPTGVSAVNAGGVTLHSLFRLPLQPFIHTEAGKADFLQKLRLRTSRLKVLRKMDLLVIDEVSMVRCDVMDAVDTVLRSVRRKPDLPFGGVQVLLIGDLYQLPPVAKQPEWRLLGEYYDSEFFFDSRVIREDAPVTIELEKIHRQQDELFISLLNKVRNDDMEAEDFEELNKRFLPGFIPEYGEKFITLTSHNAQADRINQHELGKLLEQNRVYDAQITGEFPPSLFPAEETLVLKKGAQVMFLRNDPEKRFFNGKIGVIEDAGDEKITVNCDGENIDVTAYTWDNADYAIDRGTGKLEKKVLGSFTQFPLRLAWAITIHKSQGLTFDKLMIDAAFSFTSGQVYVALSRCTSLQGIVLLSRIPANAIFCNEAVVRYHRNHASKAYLPERFLGARQVFTRSLLEELFSFDEIHKTVDLLDGVVAGGRRKQNEKTFAWIKDLRVHLSSVRVVGLKFLGFAGTCLAEQPVIEDHPALLKRISEAAGYFLPRFRTIKTITDACPVITGYRETDSKLKGYLSELNLLLDYEIQSLEYCTTRFSVTGFLRHKLEYVSPQTSFPTNGARQKQQSGTTHNTDLYRQLREWRDEVCETTGLPIYMIGNKTTLTEIATYLPRTEEALLRIKGFGESKVRRYGDDILEMVDNYCRTNNLEGNRFKDSV